MKTNIIRAAICVVATMAAGIVFGTANHVNGHAHAIAQNAPPYVISAVNTAGVSATPTPLSYSAVTIPKGGNWAVTVTVPAGSSWSGTVGAWMTHGTATRIAVPTWRIVNQTNGVPTSIPSAATGTWATEVQGPGTFYVIASNWSSGSITPVISFAPGTVGPAPWVPYSLPALTTLTLVSANPCQLGGVALMNVDAGPIYLVGFDASSTGAVTLGTTAPAFVIPYPQSDGTAANGTADRLGIPNGLTFQHGLVIAAVTTPTGSTLSTNGLSGFVWWH